MFFNFFPTNMILQYEKVGRWADYLYGERGRIILNQVGKSVLARLVFFGMIQPIPGAGRADFTLSFLMMQMKRHRQKTPVL